MSSGRPRFPLEVLCRFGLESAARGMGLWVDEQMPLRRRPCQKLQLPTYATALRRGTMALMAWTGALGLQVQMCCPATWAASVVSQWAYA